MRFTLTSVLLVLVAVAGADVIHVPGEYPTIQEGIDAASSGDIVMVAPGTYVDEIELKAGVIVRGAGEGQSIIDGGGDAGDVVKAVGNAITPDTKLQGFTITDGLCPGTNHHLEPLQQLLGVEFLVEAYRGIDQDDRQQACSTQ